MASCADSPKAEAAVAACTRLFEDGGLDARNKAIALGNRGAAYKLMGSYDAAIADFDIAIGLDPKNPQYWCQRGDAHGKKQQFAEAIADYSAALDRVATYTWAFRGRGYAYLSQGNAKLALADLNEALRAKPDDLNLTHLRGRANSQAQNWDAAIVDFTTTLNAKGAANLLPSERAIILSQRGFARLKLGRTADAKADVDEALRMAPKSAFSLAVSGLIEEERGHRPDAAALYSRALVLDPEIEFARRGLERAKQDGSRGYAPRRRPRPQRLRWHRGPQRRLRRRLSPRRSRSWNPARGQQKSCARATFPASARPCSSPAGNRTASSAVHRRIVFRAPLRETRRNPAQRCRNA